MNEFVPDYKQKKLYQIFAMLAEANKYMPVKDQKISIFSQHAKMLIDNFILQSDILFSSFEFKIQLSSSDKLVFTAIIDHKNDLNISEGTSEYQILIRPDLIQEFWIKVNPISTMARNNLVFNKKNKQENIKDLLIDALNIKIEIAARHDQKGFLIKNMS